MFLGSVLMDLGVIPCLVIGQSFSSEISSCLCSRPFCSVLVNIHRVDLLPLVYTESTSQDLFTSVVAFHAYVETLMANGSKCSEGVET